MVRNAIRYAAFTALMAALMVSAGCGRKVYENKIKKDTQQPDKVLYDTSIDDIEHGRFERARLTLQTLMNTYDTSEYLAKAKLAMADSWYREGGARGYSQAEFEYKDFILFYKNMEEAAEAQMKICKMQFEQMDKADRDPHHALRAQEECKNVLLEFPNSKHAVEAAQYLRDVQEALAEEEFRVEMFYRKKGVFSAAANRGQALTDQFPLYSQAAEALWMLADSYQHLGSYFETQQAAAYSKIAQDYPLSTRADSSRLRLQAMGKPVPEADPVAYARERYEIENRQTRGFLGKALVPFSSRPDLLAAARTGPPVMDPFKPGIPVSVPLTAAGTQGTSGTAPTVTVGAPGVGNVTGEILQNTDLIEKLPDARLSVTPDAAPAAGGTAPAGAAQGGAAPAAGGNPVTAAPAPGAPAPAPAASVPIGKPKSAAQQEADFKREQAQIKKERQKIVDQQKKQLAIMQQAQKKQEAAGAKKRAEEDADRKRAEKAAAKKTGNAAPAATPAATPAAAPAGGAGGGDSPSAKP